jgi:hypothetical protein
MKQKFTLLSILFLSLTVIAMTQNTPVFPRNFDKTAIKKMNIPSTAYKSVKEQLFYEDFSDGGFADWSVMGDGQENWMENEGNAAGGVAPEAWMLYNPAFVGISRFVSPAINTSGYTDLSLTFLHYFNVFQADDFYLRVETTSDGGATWNQAWELYWNSGDHYGAFEVLAVNTPDVGSENFQFCFCFEGDSYSMNFWSIDNINLGEFLSFDAMPLTISGADGINLEGDELFLSAPVVNVGGETITFDVHLEVADDAGLIFESTQTVTDLASAETMVIDFDPWTSTPGQNLTATVTTLLEDDENTDNDSFSLSFDVISGDYQYCIPTGLPGAPFGISDFIFAGIDNTGSGYSNMGYGHYVELEASVEIGESYDLTIATFADQNTTVWIDYNKDFIFDESEQVVYGLETPGNDEQVTIEVTIPGFAEAGSTYMRVGAQYYYGTPDDPCLLEMIGEWEDYAIEITGASMSYDVGVISIDNYWLYSQGEVIPKATIKNLGIETVSFPVTMNIGTYSSTVELMDIVSNELVEVEFDPWNALPGEHVFELETGLENDENLSNNLLEHEVYIMDEAPEKNVVGEEGTGTWCGWCPSGIVYMDSMQMKYPETWIGIAVHSYDPMEDSAYLWGLNNYFPYFPSGILNRGETIDVLDLEQYYLLEIERPAPASVYIEDKEYNSANNELTFTVSAEFFAPVANYRFSAILIENGVTGTGEGWDQANYYSGGGSGPMAGFENLPNPIPAEDMVYDHVGRKVIGEVAGVEGSLPANIEAGETHSYEFTTTLQNDWDENHIEVVGILLDYNTGRIENGAIDHLITNISEKFDSQSFVVYPNPANELVSIKTNKHLKKVQLFNISGQLVFDQTVSGNKTAINIADFKSGIYVLKVFSHNQIITKKLVIE